MGLEMGKAWIRIRGDSSGLQGDMGQARGVVEKSLGAFSAMAIAKIGGVVGALYSLKKAIWSAGGFEQTNIAFGTMIGSATETKKTLEDLTTFAAETPFEMPEIEQAAKGLIQFGERGDGMMKTLKMLGDAASGTSTPFGFLALVFNQIRGVGKLLTQDFRQLSTRGILSLQDIADYYGVATDAAQEMLSKGKISFEDVKGIFGMLTSEGGRFANMMKKQSQSFLGLWSTLTDAIGITTREIGTIFLPAAKAVVKVLIQTSEMARQTAVAVRYFTSWLGSVVAVSQAADESFKKLNNTLSSTETRLALIQKEIDILTMKEEAGSRLTDVEKERLATLKESSKKLEEQRAILKGMEKERAARENDEGPGMLTKLDNWIASLFGAEYLEEQMREKRQKDELENAKNMREDRLEQLRKYYENAREIHRQSLAAEAAAEKAHIDAYLKALEAANSLNINQSRALESKAGLSVAGSSFQIEDIDKLNALMSQLKPTAAEVAEQFEATEKWLDKMVKAGIVSAVEQTRILKAEWGRLHPEQVKTAEGLKEIRQRLVDAYNDTDGITKQVREWAEATGATATQVRKYEDSLRRIKGIEESREKARREQERIKEATEGAQKSMQDLRREILMMQKGFSDIEKQALQWARSFGLGQDETKRLFEERKKMLQQQKDLQDIQAIQEEFKTPAEKWKEAVQRMQELVAQGLDPELAQKKLGKTWQELFGGGQKQQWGTRSGLRDMGKTIQDSILRGRAEQLDEKRNGLLDQLVEGNKDVARAVREKKGGLAP